MLTLKFYSQGIIGSKKALNALENAEQARIIIASDSHGNFSILQDIIKQFGSSCDAFIFCGDGATDILQLINCTKTNNDFKQSMPQICAFVQGNCDPSHLPLKTGSIAIPHLLSLKACHKKILITHGHFQNVNSGMQSLCYQTLQDKAQIVCFGHTHIPIFEQTSDCTLINPGSCTSPRGGFPPSFAILTFQDNIIDVAHISISKNTKKTSFKIFTPL